MWPFIMKCRSLVKSWLHLELEVKQISLAQALREFNASTHSNATAGRVRAWEASLDNRGSRLSRSVRVYMAKKVIRLVLTDEGIDTNNVSNKALNRIVENLE